MALAKGEKLKAYFQQEMAGVVVDVRQTDSDFHTGLTSFFFNNEGEPSLGWLWCIKVPNSVLADLETGGITRVLEHYGWREKLRDAPVGTILFATVHGLDVWRLQSQEARAAAKKQKWGIRLTQVTPTYCDFGFWAPR